jgi:hypothetical protein
VCFKVYEGDFFVSKRSEKEARNNDDLVSQFFPVLAVTALLSYFQYHKLKKQYLTNPQAKRIDDLMAHTPILVVATFGPRWPLQISPPVATPNSPRQDAWIMRVQA